MKTAALFYKSSAPRRPHLPLTNLSQWARWQYTNRGAEATTQRIGHPHADSSLIKKSLNLQLSISSYTNDIPARLPVAMPSSQGDKIHPLSIAYSGKRN